MIILKPRPQVLTIWRIFLVIRSFVPAFLISFFLSGGLFYLLSTLWFLLFLLLFLWYLPAYYKSQIYILKKGQVVLRQGVLTNNVSSIPLDSIQFTTLSTTPISRFFGLVSLRIIAPGARINLPGLTMKEARTFQQSLQKEVDHGQPAS